MKSSACMSVVIHSGHAAQNNLEEVEMNSILSRVLK